MRRFCNGWLAALGIFIVLLAVLLIAGPVYVNASRAEQRTGDANLSSLGLPAGAGAQVSEEYLANIRAISALYGSPWSHEPVGSDTFLNGGAYLDQFGRVRPR